MRILNMIKTLPEFSEMISDSSRTSYYFLIFPQIEYTYVNFPEKVLKYFQIITFRSGR